MYGGLPITVVPCAAISRNREVPKSRDLEQALVGHEHVGRPQIAVDHALLVRVVDGVADLAGVVERARESSAPSRRSSVSSVSPGTYSITMKKTLSCFSAVMHRDDVGMVERGEQARLAQQLAEVEVLPVRDLERDLLVDPGVFREVDGAEPAAAKRREDPVLPERLPLEEHQRRVYQWGLGSTG